MFNRVWFKDTFERALATFAEAALGVWILADGLDVFHVDVAEGAASAGLIAGLAVIKGALAAKIGSATSASLDPSLATVEINPPVVRGPNV
jgi:hypothetical protein